MATRRSNTLVSGPLTVITCCFGTRLWGQRSVLQATISGKDAQVWSFFLFGKDAEAHVLLGRHRQLLFLLLFAAFAWKSHRPGVTVFSEKEILLLTGQQKEQPS